MIPNPQKVKDVLHRRVKPERHPPEHIPDQRPFMRDALTGGHPAWVLMLDSGRYDLFDQLVWDYFDGNLKRTYNGGIGYTGDWFARNAAGDYPNAGLFSHLPLRHQEGAYDGREHFAKAPDVGSDVAVQERLANLGYLDQRVGAGAELASPRALNNAVRRSDVAGGLVRYLKPHPPFVGLEDLTSGSGKGKRTKAALAGGEITHAELTHAYIETYRMGFEAAANLVPDLDGPVYLTADHGECLTCGQLFHGRQHGKHDHLTVVPWFEVDRVL